MGSNIIFVDREDIRTIEEEEKSNFIKNTLTSIGLPEEDIKNCFPVEGKVLSVQNKISLRKLCENFQISIFDDLDGGIKIYVTEAKEKTLVAEWKKCWFALRIDPSEIDRSKRTFAELHFKWWTVFEEE